MERVNEHVCMCECVLGSGGKESKGWGKNDRCIWVEMGV